ncbi:MAG: response regulator [Lachnospiraceae bacterium]|nr:response regulator [Lachnospiraceae bacterium]
MNDTAKLKRSLIVLITLIFLGIIIFSLLFFLAHILKGKDADQITYSCEEMKDFRYAGSEEHISFPGRYRLAEGEELACESLLPGVISDDTWICFLSDSNTSVYVDGELRKSYDRNKDTIIGGALKRLHIFVALYPEDAGKSIRIVWCAGRNKAVDLRPVYIGTSLGIIEQIISQDIVNFILTFALLLISLIAIGIGLLLRFSRKMVSPITSMGVGVLFMSLWLIFDSGLFQLAFRHYYIDGTMSYLMVLLIPYPFVYYLDILQEHRYRMVYIFGLFYLEIVTVCACILHFSATVDFLTMLPFIAVTEGALLIMIVTTLVLDRIRGFYRSYLISYIGMAGLLISCVFEILRVVSVDEKHVGTFVIIGLFWTITLAIIHQLYAVREAQKEAAVAVRASETKSNFLANMSHEIRTPMNAILGMDEMILREARDDPKISRYATDIKSAGNMLLSIINDILDLSKIESGKAELVASDFEICSVINDIININGRRAEDKGIGFKFDAAGDLPVRFHGDEIRARQIMLNIINNAVKYTSDGYVKVGLDMERKEAAPAAGDVLTLIISVKDTGIGIREEDMEKLFQPFDRLEETKNRKIEGTGLGLSIARNYLELMGGHIDVESVYGEGSTFTVYMPMEVVDPTPIGDFTDRIRQIKREQGDSKVLVIAPNASALVVDDNELNLDVISGLMERTRMRVDTAASGPEGLVKMERRRYDIIFLDQMMPGMDGISTLRNMHMKYDMRGVSVIALTADAVAGAREFYLEHGFDDYLSKPVKADDLEKVLKKHLPQALQITEEDIERVTEAENRKKKESTGLPPVLVIDTDSEKLKQVKKKTEQIMKGTFVTDPGKARKYLEKHDTEYVLLSKELYLKQISEKE